MPAAVIAGRSPPDTAGMSALSASAVSSAPRQRLLDLLRQLAAESQSMDILEPREPRQLVHAPVTISVHQPDGGTRLVDGWATELSPGGLGLLTDEPLPDASMTVDLGELADRPLVLKARLIYRMQLLPQTFRHGLAFQ